MHIEYFWEDDRIIHDECSGSIPVHQRNEIFKPNLYFLLLKGKKDIPTMESDHFDDMGVSNGQVWKEASIQLTMFCEMEFENYPMDTQTCRIRIINPDFGADALKFDMLSLAHNVRVPQRLLPYEISYEEMEDEEKTMDLDGRNVSVVGFNVLMKRRKV